MRSNCVRIKPRARESGRQHKAWGDRHFASLPHAINYGVSTFVMAIRGSAGARRVIEKNLDEGALGVSHSLEYQPAPYAEMLEYGKLATKYDRPLFLHLRYSSREKEPPILIRAALDVL